MEIRELWEKTDAVVVGAMVRQLPALEIKIDRGSVGFADHIAESIAAELRHCQFGECITFSREEASKILGAFSGFVAGSVDVIVNDPGRALGNSCLLGIELPSEQGNILAGYFPIEDGTSRKSYSRLTAIARFARQQVHISALH